MVSLDKRKRFIGKNHECSNVGMIRKRAILVAT